MASTSTSAPRIKALEQQVINQIAAGEVIHRPASALKEMLENSLDAGATSIAITAKGGGLKLLSIQDNGHGILREDFPRVCERFSTSKLQAYEDLQSIQTFGFRGEALASISHVAHVTITSMTVGAQCAYRGCFADGELVPAQPGEEAVPKPCAGTRGTQIVVEDMFYNAQMRRATMKGGGEEYAKLLQVVQAYAIDNAGVSLSCKKAGEAVAELHTQREQKTIDVIRLVHGAAVARELITFEAEEAGIGLTARGYVSNANHAAKRLTFLLFINKRLVESAHLRRALEQVYAAYLPKSTHAFMYLSLRLPPSALDVNVHPTKREVHFLHQEEVIEALQAALRKSLLGGNMSRTFTTQAVLPGMVSGAAQGTGKSCTGSATGAGAASQSAERSRGARAEDRPLTPEDGIAAEAGTRSGPKAVDPRKLVRSHRGMNAGELDKYICRPSASSSGAAAPKETDRGVGASSSDALRARGAENVGNVTAAPGKRSRGKESAAACEGSLDSAVRDASEYGADAAGASARDSLNVELAVPPATCGSKRRLGRPSARPWIPCDLGSIHGLLRAVTQRSHRGLRALFANHTYVGVVDAHYVLVQHLTKLYVIHLGVISEEFFYQQVLRRWGNLGTITLSSPAPVKELCVLALRAPMSGWRESDGDPDRIAAGVAELLAEKAEMLEEYLSIGIVDGAIRTLPQLVDGYVPPLIGLPTFLLRLASHVDWTTEAPCFESLSRELAALYRVDQLGDAPCTLSSEEDAANAAPQGEATAAATAADRLASHSGDQAVEQSCTAAWTVQHLLLPAIRRSYEPPTPQASNGAVIQAACTEMLYKIFERC